jgi:ribonuclease R
MSLQRLSRALGLARKDLFALKKDLQELENRGLLRQARRRFFLRSEKQIVTGEIVDVRRGYAWVRPATEDLPDIFIPARFTGGALLGDAVEVVLGQTTREERPEGKILRVLERKRDLLIGMYQEYWGQSFFLPYESPLQEELPILVPGNISVCSGQVVEIDRKTRVLKKVLGNLDDPGIDVEVIVRKYSLRSRFPQEVEREIVALTPAIPSSVLKERQDYREWVTFTIDGEDARDFDDAVSLTRSLDGNFRLGVHIADVSHYVRPGTALEREAYLRGCSVYFPETVLPMLPEKLSNDICSLRPHEDRLSYSVLLELGPEGQVLSTQFFPSVIRSAARLTYREVMEVFEGLPPSREILSQLKPHLTLMRELAEILRQRRLKAGSLDILSSEPRLIYQDTQLVGVDTVTQTEAHCLIEEFMLAANEAVAVHLAEVHAACVYRVHPPPSIQALTELRSLIQHFGMTLPDPKKIGVRHLQKIQEESRGKPWEDFLSLRVLRSLKLAIYSAENQGHFGLGKDSYLHFTSPIRRYPDLLVHRCLKQLKPAGREMKTSLVEAAAWSSDRERRSDAAEKDLVEWRIYRLLHQRLGDVFEGTILDITKAGLIVALHDYFVNGIILFQDLGGDYFVRRSEACVVGRKTGQAFTLGDNLRVTLAAVEPERRRMTLVPET